MDEVYSLSMSRTAISNCRKANGTISKIDSCDCNIYIASYILSPEPQYKWMLMATTLVTGIVDLHWILHFLESVSLITLQLPPDTLNYTLNINNYWVADRSNVSGTEPGAKITPVAGPSNIGPESGSPVHCTTITAHAYMIPHIAEVGKLRKATHTLDIIIR